MLTPGRDRPYQRERETHETRLKKGTACQACRIRKTKCNGARPACAGCVARESECVYDLDKNELRKSRRRSTLRGLAEIRPHEVVPSSSSAAFSPTTSRQTDVSLNRHLAPVLSDTPTVPESELSNQATSSPKAGPSLSNAPVVTIVTKIDTDTKISRPQEDLVHVPILSTYLVPSQSATNDADQDRATVVHRTAPPFRVASGDFALRDGVVIWNDGPGISFGPSLEFHRKTWWDRLLSVYSPHGPNAAYLSIVADLRYLFVRGDQLLSFFHIPSFFTIFLDRSKRHLMQPSIILACLALSTLMQSSETGFGSKGREKAMLLQGAAQAALESSVNAQWIEASLAQAALVLVVFEFCPHPQCSDERFASSLRMLDAIIKSLGLSYADVELERASVFPEGIAPILIEVEEEERVKVEYPDSNIAASQPQGTCGCAMLVQTPVQQSPTASGEDTVASGSGSGGTGSTQGMGWSGSARWGEDWSDEMVRREQDRRVCWSSLQVVSSYVVFQSAFGRPLSQYFITQPSNFALLFPGESLFSSGLAPSPNPTASSISAGKTTIWALNVRSMFLWCACAAMYIQRETRSDHDQATFALQVYTEAGRIEAAFDAHTCEMEAVNNWMGRYYLQYARMSATYDFQRWVPSPMSGQESVQQREARDWVIHVQRFAKMARVFQGQLEDMHRFVNRPFVVWYLIRQLSRCIRLWELDRTLMDIFYIGTAVINAVRGMLQLFPSAWVEKVYDGLEIRFQAACIAYGVHYKPTRTNRAGDR